jgi:alpha-tubulin suppressor-like RCC1 family protein
MLNSQNLIDKICSRIDCGGLTDLQNCQTSGALDILSNTVISVSTFANLPDVEQYNGRMIYVDDEKRYYYSVGIEWINDLSSNPVIYAEDAYAWGDNSNGRLGNGNESYGSFPNPVSVVGGFTDWCQVSVGKLHSLGLRSNGTLWAWGNNNYGKLGDNTTESRSSPVSVVGGFTDWCQVSTSFYHSLGLRSDGTAWAWGCNNCGQLGDYTTYNNSSPVSVVGGFTDWCQVSAGSCHSLAIKTDGTAWAWGDNYRGQLGDYTDSNSSSPVSVVGEFTDWCQVSAGELHSLGLRSNGTLWAWGINSYGQLGTYDTVNSSSPVSIVGGFTDWCQVDAGGVHNLGVRSNGTAWAWGNNYCGQLGDYTTYCSSSPVSLVGGFTDWCQVSAGFCHSLAIRSNGTAWGWGSNYSEVLGNTNLASRSSPISVSERFTTWCQVSAGYRHNLAIISRQKGF